MRISSAHLRAIAASAHPPWLPLLDRALLAKPSNLDAEELRYLRLRAGWTASEIAHALGVSSNVTVSRWESGTRRLPQPTERLFRVLMADALRCLPLRSLVEQFKASWRYALAPLETHLYPERDHFEYRWAVRPRRLPRSMQRLFWDTDPRRLNLDSQADYIIARVLEKGDLDDWNWLRWTYGEERIASTLDRKPKISPATIHLWRNGLLARLEGP